MPGLGDLLALLHDAPGRVQRLRAEIVTSTDHATAMLAGRIAMDRAGATLYAPLGDEVDEPPSRHEQRTRIWVDLGRRRQREEAEGARERLAVRDQGSWWSWDPDGGAVSGHDDEVGPSVAEARRWVLGGLRLLAPLRLEPIGAGTVAGRETLRCRATPLPKDADDD